MLVCLDCGHNYAETGPRWRCACSGRLRRDVQARFVPAEAAAGPATLWRYASALGLSQLSPRVTLGEGLTPLIPFRLDGRELLLKLDYLCPTGSYKDRGSTLMLSKLKQWGVGEIVEDSSGNAGASIAAYAAFAGIAARIFVPAATSEGKVAQIAVSGARLERVAGSREDTARAAREAGERGFYASHNWSPYFFEGLKTAAYEICEQMNWQAPAWVVTPAGNGGLAAALHAGFAHLARCGVIECVPRLAAVQAAQCAPIYRAWRNRGDGANFAPRGKTAAEGIAIAAPVRGAEVVEAVDRSNGVVLAVGEEEIWSALEALAARGVFVEPTAAAAAAGARALIAGGAGDDGGPIVVVLTGSGLKATEKIVQHFTESAVAR